MTLVEFATYASAAYFAGFGIGFVVRPQLADQFGLKWVVPAGKTEVRCYYGAVSCALAAFLVYLVHEHQSLEALTGVLFLASAVFVTRVVGTAIDGGWGDRYTRLALPVEALFVLVVGAIRIRG